jgi:uncharacterized protein (DUF1778 family)
MPSKPKRPRLTGAEHAKKNGLVAVALMVTPAERDLIWDAAGATQLRSMSAFARAAVVALARKVDRDPRLKDSENFSRFLETL